MTNSAAYPPNWQADTDSLFPRDFDLEVMESTGWVPRSRVVGALMRDLTFYALASDRLTHVNGINIGHLAPSHEDPPGHLIEGARIQIEGGLLTLGVTVWLAGRMVEFRLDELSTLTVVTKGN